MDLNNYIGKKVLITISNGFAFIGVVINADENSITMIDKTNLPVTLKENIICQIKEIPK